MNDVREDDRSWIFLTCCRYGMQIWLPRTAETSETTGEDSWAYFDALKNNYRPEAPEHPQRTWFNTRRRREGEEVSNPIWASDGQWHQRHICARRVFLTPPVESFKEPRRNTGLLLKAWPGGQQFIRQLSKRNEKEKKSINTSFHPPRVVANVVWFADLRFHPGMSCNIFPQAMRLKRSYSFKLVRGTSVVLAHSVHSWWPVLLRQSALSRLFLRKAAKYALVSKEGVVEVCLQVAWRHRDKDFGVVCFFIFTKYIEGWLPISWKCFKRSFCCLHEISFGRWKTFKQRSMKKHEGKRGGRSFYSL